MIQRDTDPISFLSVARDLPASKLPDNILQDGENIVFINGCIERRNGLALMATSSLPLNGPITGIFEYHTIQTDDTYLLACTPTDIYVYNQERGRFEFRTRNYNVSTVTSSGTGNRTITLAPASVKPTGTTTSGSKIISSLSSMTGLYKGMIITGSGVPSGSFITKVNTSTIEISAEATASATVSLTITANWFNTEWDQLNLYQISFDSDDMTKCTTWYTVSKMDSTTQLTLAADLASAVSAHTYCLRLCYKGDTDDQWSMCTPYNSDNTDKVALLTNGQDFVQVWDATDHFTNFIQYPNVCKYIGFWGSISYHHIIFANVYDTASSVSFTQTIELSDAGSLDFNGTFYELPDNRSPIIHIQPLQTQLVIYKKESISLAQVRDGGGNTDPLIIRENAVQGIGAVSGRTVQDIGSRHILYTGKDIITFDGYNHPSVATGNIQYILANVNKQYEHRSYSFLIEEQNLYCLMVPWGDSEYPNYCIVYNYKDESWVYWNFLNRTGADLYSLSHGKYCKSYSPRWSDRIAKPTGTWTSGSNQITLSSVDGVEEGMRIEGAGITDISYITGLSGSVATITYNTTAGGSSTALEIGWTARQINYRWSDLIVNDNFTRTLLGDASGYLYEQYSDYIDDAGNAFISRWMTKDYDINMPGCDLRLLAATLAMHLKDNYESSIQIRSSVNAGRNWTAWQTVPLDGLETYMEKKVYYNMLGKTVCYEIQTITPFVFESLRSRVSGEYKSFKFDN